MKPIICPNNGVDILQKMKEFLSGGGIIKDICILEQNNKQIVFLLGNETIQEEKAQIWWSGYSAGLEAAL